MCGRDMAGVAQCRQAGSLLAAVSRLVAGRLASSLSNLTGDLHQAGGSAGGGRGVAEENTTSSSGWLSWRQQPVGWASLPVASGREELSTSPGAASPDGGGASAW